MKQLKGTVSEITGKPFPLRMILHSASVSVSAWYAKEKSGRAIPGKRGPKTKISDSEIIMLIKEVIEGLPFRGVGYRKITAYLNKNLKKRAISVGKNRVLRLMRDKNLLMKPSGGSGSSRAHDGKIITDKPNEMWATDGKKFWTAKDGWCWFFGVIDHFNSEIIDFHCSKNGTRFQAIRPIVESVIHRFGSVEKNIASGLHLRVDRGSQYMSKYFQSEVNMWGIILSPTWARSPESNGIIERFHRTLQEQVFDVNQFATIAEARLAIKEFIHKYNHEWILERLDYESPINYRKIYENGGLKKCA